jgi:hypothetical protein
MTTLTLDPAPQQSSAPQTEEAPPIKEAAPASPCAPESSESAGSAALATSDPANETARTAGLNPDSVGAITDLLHQINDGVVNSADLDPAVRQECVHHLTLEGYTNDSICMLLRISERTVRRDRQIARRNHGVKPDYFLGDTLLGEYENHTHASIRRLVRLCNDPQTPPYVRLWAEESIGRIYHRYMEMARRMKYFQDGQGRVDRQYRAANPPPPPTPAELALENIMRSRGLIH